MSKGFTAGGIGTEEARWVSVGWDRAIDAVELRVSDQGEILWALLLDRRSELVESESLQIDLIEPHQSCETSTFSLLLAVGCAVIAVFRSGRGAAPDGVFRRTGG